MPLRQQIGEYKDRLDRAIERLRSTQSRIKDLEAQETENTNDIAQLRTCIQELEELISEGDTAMQVQQMHISPPPPPPAVGAPPGQPMPPAPGCAPAPAQWHGPPQPQQQPCAPGVGLGQAMGGQQPSQQAAGPRGPQAPPRPVPQAPPPAAPPLAARAQPPMAQEGQHQQAYMAQDPLTELRGLLIGMANRQNESEKVLGEVLHALQAQHAQQQHLHHQLPMGFQQMAPQQVSADAYQIPVGRSP
eukprot:5083275-Pyramimonas_sp.AAC.1